LVLIVVHLTCLIAACRIYNQSKSDPSVHHHSCVVFTTGAAIVTLLRWLCDVRHKVGHDANALLRERVVFCLQKGKASRIEQPSPVICEAVRTLLAGHGSPFKVELQDKATQLEASGNELVTWLHSPAFSSLAFLVHANRSAGGPAGTGGWGMTVMPFSCDGV
jgi:pentatricopeptide repeat domain-containing protein 1